jgi:hypothetical protein
MLASLNKDVVRCLRRTLRAQQMKFGAPAYITGTVHTRDNLVQYIGYAQYWDWTKARRRFDNVVAPASNPVAVQAQFYRYTARSPSG